MPLYLTEADVESLLAPADAVDVIEGSFGRIAEPAEMASVALFLLSDWASYVAGVTLASTGRC